MAFLLGLFLLPGPGAAVPSPQSVGSDLTILTHNDLYGNASTRQAAAIVLSARQSNVDSASACGELHETLWNPSTSNSNSNSTDLSFLQYLGYNTNSASSPDLYWIASSGDECRAITALGEIQSKDCTTQLPALCSQSAALSFPDNDPTPEEFQVSVSTGNATVTGYRDKLSFRFLGIKYAPKPVRFGYSTYQAPSGNVSALAYGAGCIQTYCTADMACGEDCLHLNVWTPTLPAAPSSEKKAVMLWIHGGGFTSGFGSDTTFDGGNMASRGDVLVVTLNYRLSTLGFLALDDSPLKGNYWLSDLIAGLDWVQAHISDFGGDPEKVTVFGQSAGAAAVRAVLASPLSKGKLSRAIMQSCPGGGSSTSFSEYESIADAANTTDAILQQTGCALGDQDAEIACLRALEPRVLLGLRNGSFTGTVASTAVLDGTYLTTRTLLLDGSVPQSPITVLTGVMRDDGDPFTTYPKTLNATQALLSQGFDGPALLSSGLFPMPSSSTNQSLNIFNLTSRAVTDSSFRCATQSTTFSAATSKTFPAIYAYENHRAYQITRWSPNPPTCEAPITATHPYGDPTLPYFQCHSGDLFTVFGTTIRQSRHPRDENDIPFSQYLLDSWTAFARTRDPNPALDFLKARAFANTTATVEKTERWEPVDAAAPRLRVLDAVPEIRGFLEEEQCDFLGTPLDYYLKK